MSVVYTEWMNIRGFTLIEIIVVILLVAILMAMALPRFLGVDDQARLALVSDTVGKLQTSVGLAHSVWQVKAGGNPAENLEVFGSTLSGQIDFNTQGWPSQQWFGGLEANPSTNNVADCISVVGALLQSSQTFSALPDADYLPTYLGGGRCRYTYNLDNSLSFEYDSLTGRVSSNF